MRLKKNIIFVLKHLLIPYYFCIILVSIFKIKFLKKNISENEYQVMINFFLVSNGWSNRIINNILKKKINSKNKKDTDSEILDIAKILNIKGYFVKENFLSVSNCSSILERSLNLDGYYKEENRPDLSNFKTRFDRSNPKGTMFFYNESELLNIPEIQAIVSDAFLINIAKEYFEGSPILSAVNMWWTTKFKNTADSECAQNFHFDMDSLKWLKFFIYITDVNRNNGPHTFVEGSHKLNSLPYSIRSLGYSRIDDNLVIDKFGNKNLVEFDKSAGTLIVEDTKGLHKGKNIEKGDRLILQLEFTSSGFIKNTKRDIMNFSLSDKFLNFYKTNNYLMQFYQIK
jgi:hypothetical protein